MDKIIISNDNDLNAIYNKFKKHCKKYAEAILENGKELTVSNDIGDKFIVNLIVGAQAIACKICQGEHSNSFSTDSYEMIIQNGKAVLGEELFYTDEEIKNNNEGNPYTTLKIMRDDESERE